MGKIKVEFESSYEPNGPFGAKSIGEVVINHRCLPFPMRSTMPLVPGSMSCPSHRKNRHGSCRKAEMIDEKFFRFLRRKGHVISLVGGGGKTTLMYNLAAHCARKGVGGYWPLPPPTSGGRAEIMPQTDAKPHLWVAGVMPSRPLSRRQIDTALPPEQLERWMEQADIVL